MSKKEYLSKDELIKILNDKYNHYSNDKLFKGDWIEYAAGAQAVINDLELQIVYGKLKTYTFDED